MCYILKHTFYQTRFAEILPYIFVKTKLFRLNNSNILHYFRDQQDYLENVVNKDLMVHLEVKDLLDHLDNQDLPEIQELMEHLEQKVLMDLKDNMYVKFKNFLSLNALNSLF